MRVKSLRDEICLTADEIRPQSGEREARIIETINNKNHAKVPLTVLYRGFLLPFCWQNRTKNGKLFINDYKKQKRL